MATILVVDDNGSNRKLVVTLLTHEGHRLIEARDGLEGLEAARTEIPDLVISDILMPSMDGFEFVRRLRADPQLHNVAVIFYTAHYHETEARNLAEACRVSRVIVRSSGAAGIVKAVSEVLAGNPDAPPQSVDPGFDREHLQLITNKLAQKANQLKVANARFAALTELNVQLASEREPRVLFEKVCRGARNLLGAKYSVLAVEGDAGTVIYASSGVDVSDIPCVEAGLLGRVASERRPWRVSSGNASPIDAGLPGRYPPARAFLAAPVMSLTQSFGWLCLADKVGAEEFSAEDELILSVLGAQSGRIYENGRLYFEVQHHAAQLQVQVDERARAAAELKVSEERFRELAENIQDAFFVVAGDLSCTLYMSPAYAHIWGRPWTDGSAAPLPWTDSIHAQDLERLRAEVQQDPRGLSEQRELEFRIVRPDGEVRWICARTFPIAADNSGRIGRVVGVATDITQRKQSEAQIEHLNRVHAMLSGINSLIVRVADRTELFWEACRLAVEYGRFRMAWCSWLDPETSQVTPVAWAGDAPDLAQAMACKLGAVGEAQESLISASMRLQQPVICDDLLSDSKLVPPARQMLERGHRAIVALPLVIEAESVGCLVLVMDESGFFNAAEMRLLSELCGDISFALDHIKKAERLNYLAYYDSLTGLANRTFFYERLAQYVSAAARGQRKFALVIADLERFETINDTFGRHAGDELLRQLGERLAGCVGDASEVARLGADQFAAVIFDVGTATEVAQTIEKWRHQWLGAPFTVEGTELRLSAKVAVAVYPADGHEPVELIRNAEAALKNAKTTGDRLLFYAPHLTARANEALNLENQLKRAIEQEEFVLYYQPKVDLDGRRLQGVEALIRWQHPQMGLVPPMKFIPLLEETGMIIEVGNWALRQAILDRGMWVARHLHAPRIAVNVSTVQLQRTDFVRSVANVLKLSGHDPGLDIEVTESVIMKDATGNIEKLRALRELGVRIAIDDFGTGYSSLAYLTKLPAQTLKIDRSFVIAMLEDPATMTLVSTVISLAHSLKLVVVAEGVESEEQARFLHLLRCDQMQGYLISKPLSFADMTTWLGRSRGEQDPVRRTS
ncbi:MAG: EAL domain-containing protein [Proteobacteria bacterium]|nr:EAL domain-containing protein [Pseudomonadota bacterium]